MTELEDIVESMVAVAESYEAKARAVRKAIAILLGEEEEPSTSTTADAAETSSPSSPTDEPTPSGANGADPTSPPTVTSGSETTSPAEAAPARTKSATREEIDQAWESVQAAKKATDVPPPRENRKRQFTNDQKGLLVRRCVREGVDAVATDTLVHPSTLHRWMREKPRTVSDEEQKMDVEKRQQALAEAHPPVEELEPSVEELEAEKDRPVPPRVQWPSTPIERRPFNPDRVRSETVERGV